MNEFSIARKYAVNLIELCSAGFFFCLNRDVLLNLSSIIVGNESDFT